MLPTKSQTGNQSKTRKRCTVQVVTMEEVEDQDSHRQLSVQSQLPLDPSIILEEAPTAIQASRSSGSGGNGNKKTTTGKVTSGKRDVA